MIYEETYRYLLNEGSSAKFDACLYSVLHMDWEGVIRSPFHQMAKNLGTTEKYLKRIIRDFSEPKEGGRRIFVPYEPVTGAYRFNLGSAPGLATKKDRYCKKYRFFYTDAFRGLPLPAKRLVLVAAFRMSIHQNETLPLHFQDIIASISSFSRKKEINAAVETINRALGATVLFTTASSLHTREEFIIASFKTGTLQEFHENRTERMLLRQTMFEAGYLGLLNEGFCSEIERVGKYIFRSFLKSAHGQVKDELIKLARFVYHSSIIRLSNVLPRNPQLQKDPKQASAYFSTIVYQETWKQAITCAHQAASIKHLLNGEFARSVLQRRTEKDKHAGSTEPIRLKHEKTMCIFQSLNAWCEEWVIARAKSALTEKDPANRFLTLKKQIHLQLNELTQLYKRLNHSDSVLEILQQKKEALNSYLSIQLDRLYA